MTLVTIGLPVHNGARFLQESMRSIVEQSHTDLEILVSDNHSDDETPDILSDWAARDTRVRVIRPPRFVGAAHNFNFVVSAAQGEYFRWHTHDDLMAADLVRNCLAVLESDSRAISCHPVTEYILEGGATSPEPREGRSYSDAWAPLRLLRFLIQHRRCDSVLGVFRRSALLESGLVRSHRAGDEVLMAELTIRGRVTCSGKADFFRRLYPDARGARATGAAATAWFDPERVEEIEDVGRYLRQCYRDLVRALPLGGVEAWSCRAAIELWFIKRSLVRRWLQSQV